MGKKEVKQETGKAQIKENPQPEVNIIIVGHVDHGKTTLLEKLSGKWADTHSEEMKRGITIKLGYADINIHNCPDHSYGNKKCCEKAVLERKISFIDAPGHETLMATMLSGAALVDGALLLIAANEECPQPQTKEHLMALEVVGIKNIVVVQNKIDTLPKEEVIQNYKVIKEFLKGSIAENAPIIPVSALHNVNINKIFEAIQKTIPTPTRDLDKKPIMFIARSFDVNKPGSEIAKLNGGVLGGAVKQGIFKKGDIIEIAPGRSVQERGKEKWVPIETTIRTIISGGSKLDQVQPGGSIAIETGLDPAIVKSDQLSGTIICRKGELPKYYSELEFIPKLLTRVVGIKEDVKVDPIKKGEPLMLSINSSMTSGVVDNLQKDKIHIILKRPICAEEGSTFAICRRLGSRWRLIGTGILK